MEMPMLSDYSNISNFLQAVRLWQVVEMKNDCLICWGDNMNVMCDACGWWGKVPPSITKTTDMNDPINLKMGEI